MFYCHLFKCADGPTKTNGYDASGRDSLGKDSDFVFICDKNVCSYILHVKIMHILYREYTLLNIDTFPNF